MHRGFSFLDGGGEMGEAIRSYDWTANDLGPLEGWPTALKIALGMALNSKFPKCILWGPSLIMLHNDAFRPMLGAKPPALGRAFAEVWSEAWNEIGPIAERAYAGEATFIENFPLVIDRYGYPEQCYFTFCYSPIRDEQGIVRGVIDTVIETSETVEAQRQARLLNGELGHRIKNSLTVVSAIVNQTLTSTETDVEARQALTQRIDALAKAQSLLTRSVRAGADLRDVIKESLTPFRTGTGKFTIEGSPVLLSSRQALSLALAINELATNALKYGALSVPSGEVRLTWSAGRPGTEDAFRLVWAESGGPPVREPSRRGFGSRVIEQALAYDFKGEATLIHEPDGVRCELRTQMIQLGEE